MKFIIEFIGLSNASCTTVREELPVGFELETDGFQLYP